MSQEFSHKSSILNKGLACPGWIKLYITPEHLSGDELIEVYNSNGTKTFLPFHQVGFIMYKFKLIGTSITSVPLMHENKVVYFDIKELYLIYSGLKTHVLWKPEYSNKVAIIPLGSPVNINANIPWQQSARMYLSRGNNNLNMSNDNLANMLWNMVSSIAFSIVSANTETETESLFNLLEYITSIIKKFIKECKVINGITQQLQNTPVTQDNGQHVLSVCINQETLNPKMLLNILHTTLKRTYKHNQCLFIKQGDTHPILGLILTMVLAPLFNKFLNNLLSREEFLSEYYKTFIEINQKVLQEKYNNLLMNEIKIFTGDLEIIKLIVSKLELPDNHDGYAQLLDHAQKNKMVSIPCRVDYWGIIPIIKPFIDIETDNIFLSNRKEKLISEAFIDNKSENIVFITSSHTTEWSAINFKTNGKYSIKVKCLGVANQGIGNCLGKEYTANMRFTFGNYVLPTDREGYSIAGMHFINGKYINKKSVSIEKEIILELTDRELVISNPQEIIRLPRKFSIEPALIGFKNVIFDISLHKTIDKFAPAALLS